MVMRAMAITLLIGCTTIVVTEASTALAKQNAPVVEQAEFNVIQEKIDILQKELQLLQKEQAKQNQMEMPVPESGVSMPEPIPQSYTIFKHVAGVHVVEDLGIKQRQYQDQNEQMQMQQLSDNAIPEPWEAQGYEQSVQRAKNHYQTDEKAKCSKKLYYYTTKLEMHPKNEYYRYTLDRWLKKCK